MVARWLLLFFLSISYAQAQDVTGDLNTNIQASTVDSNNESESITNNYNSGAPGRESNPVPTAMAPTIMGSGGNDSCLIAKSSGLQVSLFGVARGGMEQDERCNLRKNARLLGAPQAVGGLGLQVSGISVLCRDQEIFKAMALSGLILTLFLMLLIQAILLTGSMIYCMITSLWKSTDELGKTNTAG